MHMCQAGRSAKSETSKSKPETIPANEKKREVAFADKLWDLREQVCMHVYREGR